MQAADGQVSAPEIAEDLDQAFKASPGLGVHNGLADAPESATFRQMVEYRLEQTPA
jgi:hypothetical protein